MINRLGKACTEYWKVTPVRWSFRELHVFLYSFGWQHMDTNTKLSESPFQFRYSIVHRFISIAQQGFQHQAT